MDLGIDFDIHAKKAKKGKVEPIPVVVQRAPTKKRGTFEAPLPGISRDFEAAKDPLKQQLRDAAFERYQERKRARSAKKEESVEDLSIDPELYVRTELRKQPEPEFPRPTYIYKDSKKLTELKKANAAPKRPECPMKGVKLDKPATALNVDEFKMPSPDVSKIKVKVVPRQPSASVSQAMPPSPRASKLKLIKPKSGVVVNIDSETKKELAAMQQLDSYDLLYHKMPRPSRKGKVDSRTTLKSLKRAAIMEETERLQPKEVQQEVQEETFITQIIRDTGVGQDGEEGGRKYESMEMMMRYRKAVNKVSASTSLNSRELQGFPHYEEEDLEKQPAITTIIQKFRRESEEQRWKPPKKKVKHGTFQSHSFTSLTQTTIKDYFFGLVMGNINQENENFSDASKGVQGICMPVAAYCFSILINPITWTDLMIDEVVEMGDRLYNESISTVHNHEFRKELKYHELSKFCCVRDKRVKFEVFEPDLIGQIRSTDPKIYSLSKGLCLFYQRHQAGIFKTYGLHILIWKESENHYCFFDATGRKKDFSKDITEGKALMALFYDIATISSVMLDNAKLENWPFSISKISVYKILGKDEPEEDFPASLHKEQSEYNILNESKAVLQGSFDLADLCFDFSRNKQAIAMVAVCLVYSRITPPSAWHKRTVDKIMIIGNQLYLELVEAENIVEMTLENIPASFTVGPYLVEILIYSKVAADVLYRRNICTLSKILEKFFCTSSMAIVIIGSSALAIWKQRGMYYCFDPYSRNNEGLKCRNGSACVSMNSTLEMLMDTVSYNFDNKNDIFYVHALKILRINRDAAQAHLWPRTMTMDEFQPQACKHYKMQKTNKKAVKKPVTVDVQENAVQKLMPWEFLNESVIDVGSTVESIQKDQMPPMVQKYASRQMLRSQLPTAEKPIDLDSPSLSDTQIQPEKPEPVRGDEGLDLDNWELTQEEIELQEGGGGEGEDYEDGGEAAFGEGYMTLDEFAQVREGSLDPYRGKMSAQINTDLTFCFLPMKRRLLPPTDLREKRKIVAQQQIEAEKDLVHHLADGDGMEELEVTQSQELAKESNFVNLPDKSQIVRGTANISNFGSEVEYMAPFTCLMAAAIAKKYAIISWSPAIIDYTLTSGAELFKLSKVRFDQVPVLEVPKVSLGKSDYSILSEYLYDNLLKPKILEMTLEKILFERYECGLVVTPYYACTVFFKNQLFYLYDCFGCNEVGLGMGPSNKGKACFSRFRSLDQMIARIMFNKSRRECAEEFDFTRFVVSRVEVKALPRPPKAKKMAGEASDYEEDQVTSEKCFPKSPGKKKVKVNELGYQNRGGTFTLQGNSALKGRAEASTAVLKEDHFVCACAVLTLLCYPLSKWDTYRIDYVLDKGREIYANAKDLDYTERRYIKNILIYKYFFDIIVSTVKMLQAAVFTKSLDTVMHKRDFIMVQFSNVCYVVYKNMQGIHVFDPYASKPDGSADNAGSSGAGWTMFPTLKEAKKRISSQMKSPDDGFIYYTLEITSVKKAPKQVVLAQNLMQYEVSKPVKPPVDDGRPFNEKDIWLKADPVPWSRIKGDTACGRTRNKKIFMWHQWDVEYPNDLYSLVSNIHLHSPQFAEELRGKQTLPCLIASIGMLQIYCLSEWNASIMDSIVEAGNAYFVECLKGVASKENYEIGVEDLVNSITVFPYTMKVGFKPIVNGTMFVLRQNQFNLYKALRYFCDDYAKHMGIVLASKGDPGPKRMIAFGKISESEYFMFDCQRGGPPMFADRYGLAYALRCRTLKRLLHAMTLTLRGGDFYIFEVSLGNRQPLMT